MKRIAIALALLGSSALNNFLVRELQLICDAIPNYFQLFNRNRESFRTSLGLFQIWIHLPLPGSFPRNFLLIFNLLNEIFHAATHAAQLNIIFPSIATESNST